MATPTPLPPLHIAILGASISGLALSIGLSAHPERNISHTVYESAPSARTLGAGIAFGPNALRAMALLDPRFRGAYDAIATGNGSAGREHVFHDVLGCESGWRWGQEEEGEGEGEESWRGESVAYECYSKSSVSRRELLDVMMGLVESGRAEGRVRFGMRAVRVEQGTRGGVRIVFADGSSVVADAVVGCDGGKSVVRRAVVVADRAEDGDGEEDGDGDRNGEGVATYAGRYVYRAVVPMDEAREILGECAVDGKVFVGEGRYFATYAMAGGTLLNFLAGRRDDKPWSCEQWTEEVSKEEMVKDFEGCDARLLKLLDYVKPLHWSLHHHLHTPTYFKNLLCLVGDAAHASTPHQGAGAGQCLEDALILSHLLAQVSQPQSHHRHDRTVDISLAFEAYDHVRRPRAQKVVKTSDDAGKMYCFMDPECGSDMKKIVANARERFGWIWEVDLCEEVRKAERRLEELREERGSQVKGEYGEL